MSGFEPDIGLEIHVQLATRTKLFCADAAEFGGPPNTRVCPVCLGLPGALPVTNGRAVELAARAALGLGCTVHESSRFARKNYFYPDLPKGYQITQYDEPLATGGQLRVPDSHHVVRIRRIHLEEDAGRLLHDRFAGLTAIDLNRAGVALIEIVTEPDLHSPDTARRFLDRLKQTLQYLEVGDCDMEKGSLRVDVNVSVRPSGTAVAGIRTEVKNLNSFAHVEHALTYEIDRQTTILAAGGNVTQETLLWDAARGAARRLRSKEESPDYRYFSEPDLPAVVLPRDVLDTLAARVPELPDAREARLRAEYGLPAYDAAVLAADRRLADYYEHVARAAGDGKAASNWVMTDVLRWLNHRGLQIAELPVAADALGALIQRVRGGTLSNSAARQVFRLMAETGESADDLIARQGLALVADEAALEKWADDVVSAYPAEVERYREGDSKLFGFLMGRLMQRSGGAADPRRASTVLRRRLES
jgi:aspartyl-tRNA(Asn)/glutamyl-tRNA(Gln) amidotransferase subunit B